MIKNKKLINTTLEELGKLIKQINKLGSINIYTIITKECKLKSKSPSVRFVYFVAHSEDINLYKSKSDLYEEYKLIKEKYSTKSSGALSNTLGRGFKDVGEGEEERLNKKTIEILSGTKTTEQLIENLINTIKNKNEMEAIKKFLEDTTINDIVLKSGCNLELDLIYDKKTVEEYKEEPATQKIESPKLLLETLETLETLEKLKAKN